MNPSHRKILVVDDEIGNRLLPGLFLRAMGHEVMECANAQDAYALLARHHFTDVLLDISLPEVSGLEICRALRASPGLAGLRIVAYTAHAMPEETRSFTEGGFDQILIKPIRRDDLVGMFPVSVATAD